MFNKIRSAASRAAMKSEFTWVMVMMLTLSVSTLAHFPTGGGG